MRTGVSDISERSGVIIKRSERGGEIVDDLLCLDTATQMSLFVNDSLTTGFNTE